MWSIIRPSHLRCKYFIATAISYSQDISLAQANFIDKSTRRSKCFFLTPQTVIPLTGKMSRSDKRVIARNEQLEPVTGQKYCRATVLEADVALCISSYSPHPFLCHRQRGKVSQLTAACSDYWGIFSFISSARFSNLWCGVTVQKSDKPKRSTHALRKCFFLAPQTGLEPVTPRLTAACSANWAIEAYSVFSALLGSRTCDRSETLSHYFAFARSAMCFFLFSDCFFVHRTRSPAKQLTAVLFLSFG